MSRITRALLLAGALALLVPASAAAEPAFVSLGSFDAPISVTAPPRDTSRVFVVERGGTIQVVKGGTRVGTPFLDISGDVDQAGERGLLSMTFAPDYATSGLFYVYMVARAARWARSRSASTSDRPRTPTAPTRPGGSSAGRRTTRSQQPQRRHRSSWGRTATCGSRPATAAGATTSTTTRATSRARSARCCGSTARPRQRGEHGIPASNPFGTASLGLRPAQPVPLLVRPRVGRPVDRGRRPGRARGGRLRDGGGAWGAAATTAGRAGRGRSPGRRSCTVSRAYIRAGLRLRQRGRHTRGDRRRTSCATPGCRRCSAATCTPTPTTGVIRSLLAALAARRPTTVRRRPREGAEPLGSFGEDACGHVYVVSIDGGVVQRIQDGAPGACVLKPAPPALPPLGGAAAAGAVVRPAPTAPRRACGSGSRARAASAAARGRGSRSPPARLPRHHPRPPRRLDARSRARTSLRAGRRTVMRLRPKAKASSASAARSAATSTSTLRVSVTAVDAAGNTGHATRRLTVKRA